MKLFHEKWERKILGKLYDRIRDQNAWRIENNGELEVMYRKPNIVTTIKVRRLKWVGHVVRIADDWEVKKSFLGKPGGRRGVGRPKLRWTNSLENVLKLVDVNR